MMMIHRMLTAALLEAIWLLERKVKHPVPRALRKGSRLHALPVEWCQLERRRVDPVEAADIDGDHLRPVRAFALAEGLHAAIPQNMCWIVFLLNAYAVN